MDTRSAGKPPRNLGEFFSRRTDQALSTMGFKPVQAPKPLSVAEVHADAAGKLKAQHYGGGYLGRKWNAKADANVQAFLKKNMGQAKVDAWNKQREGAPTEFQAILDKYNPSKKY